jgi:hypothetical protein
MMRAFHVIIADVNANTGRERGRFQNKSKPPGDGRCSPF